MRTLELLSEFELRGNLWHSKWHDQICVIRRNASGIDCVTHSKRLQLMTKRSASEMLAQTQEQNQDSGAQPVIAFQLQHARFFRSQPRSLCG
jgi:hypothetical protein